jgi:hypothetical protein
LIQNYASSSEEEDQDVDEQNEIVEKEEINEIYTRPNKAELKNNPKSPFDTAK